MLTLFWAGAVLSTYLGYKQHEWWMPAAVACAALAAQFAVFQSAGGSWGPGVQLLGYALMDTVMFFATFGIGRSASRWKGRWRRRGAR